jgi:hypothetical protein
MQPGADAMTHILRRQLSISVQLLAAAIASLVLLVAAGTTVQAEPTPPPAQADLPIEIIVRTGDGVPVPGIVVTLHAPSADIGGSPTPLPDQQGTTGADGQVVFANLGHWVWYATFQGAFAGSAIQGPDAQGKPPWGTNPQGNGFPLVVDPQLENEANIATPAASEPTTISRIVLVPGENAWIPALDLADEAATPISLPTAQAGTAQQAVDPFTPEPGTAGDSPRPGTLFWVVLVGGISVLALYLRWRQQRLAVEPPPEILAGSLNDADREPVRGPVRWADDGEGSHGDEPSLAQAGLPTSSQGE